VVAIVGIAALLVGPRGNADDGDHSDGSSRH
jgi:hypothetical protein